MSNSRFKHFPDRPKSEQCGNAFLVLSYAHDAASAFLDSFEEVRKARNAKGAPTDEEQDLLRAMLTFSTAGLDSMVKHLIREALPSVIDRSLGAGLVFRKFVERRILRGEQLDHAFLAMALTERNPRQELINALVNDLTGESLQSVDQLFKAASYFDIPTKEICSNPESLRPIFVARNEIVHEMDIDMTQANRNRRPRARKFMYDYANNIFEVSQAFLSNVDKKLTS